MSGWKKIVDGEIIQRERNNEPHSHHLQKEGREELRHHLWEKNEINSSDDALRRIATHHDAAEKISEPNVFQHVGVFSWETNQNVGYDFLFLLQQ